MYDVEVGSIFTLSGVSSGGIWNGWREHPTGFVSHACAVVSGWEMAPYIEAIDSQQSSPFTVMFILFHSNCNFFFFLFTLQLL